MSLPTLGTLAIDEGRVIEVPVDDLGGNARVRVDYAVSATEPAETSHLWRTLTTVSATGSVFTSAQTYGTTVWFRASGRTTSGEQTSTYTDPVSFDVDDVPRFDSAGATLNDGITPVVTWTGSALTEGVRILWDVHPADEDAGSFASFDDVIESAGEFEIPVSLDIGEAITIRIEAWSEWNSGTSEVDGDLGEFVVTTLNRETVPQAPLPVRLVEDDAYTLVDADAGIYLRISHATGAVLTVPEDATVDFAIGTMIRVEQAGAGPVTIAPETSLPMLNSLGNMLNTAGQYAVVRMVKVASDAWTLYGDLAS